MGKAAPAPPDYQALQNSITTAAGQQTAANRPTITTPWAQQSWTRDAQGNSVMNTELAGGLQDAARGLQQQVGGLFRPFDFGQFGQAQTGDAAREQAINAAYGQASSRLDPMWQQREDQARTRLLNQGLDPTSEAYRNAMGELGNQRTDAYNQAMYSAIGQGTQAGDVAFRNNMLGRQTAIADALRQRHLPMQELAQLRGFTEMPSFMGDSATLQGAMGSANFAHQAYQQQLEQARAAEAAAAQGVQGGMSAAASMLPLLFALSDERAKRDIRRTEVDALPGVPFATWEYVDGLGPPGRHVGVIAQDLEKVAPQYVRTRPDGLKEVDYSFLVAEVAP